MNALTWQHPSERRSYAQCLACSVVLHAAVVAGGIGLVAGLELAPQPEPFRWDVSVVGPGGASGGPPPGTMGLGEARVPVASSSATGGEPPPATVTRETEPAQFQPVQAINQEPPPKHTPLRHAKPKTPVEELAKGPPSEPSAESLSQESRSAAPASPVPEPVPAAPPAEPLVASRTPIEAPSGQAHVQQSDLGQVTTAEGTSSTAHQPAASDASVQTGPAGSPDYGWIADALWKRIEQLKRYPHLARINRLEGKVVLRAVIKADGQLVELEVAKSSGHSVLDHDALEVLRRASPLSLTRPLGKPQMVVQIPISYKLDR